MSSRHALCVAYLLVSNQADVVVRLQTQQLSVTLLHIALYWLYYGYTMAMARLYYGQARPES